MNNIIDPVSLKKYSIFSAKGKSLLKSYVKYLQTGGAGGAGEIDNYKTDKAKNFVKSINAEIKNWDCYLKKH